MCVPVLGRPHVEGHRSFSVHRALGVSAFSTLGRPLGALPVCPQPDSPRSSGLGLPVGDHRHAAVVLTPRTARGTGRVAAELRESCGVRGGDTRIAQLALVAEFGWVSRGERLDL